MTLLGLVARLTTFGARSLITLGSVEPPAPAPRTPFSQPYTPEEKLAIAQELRSRDPLWAALEARKAAEEWAAAERAAAAATADPNRPLPPCGRYGWMPRAPFFRGYVIHCGPDSEQRYHYVKFAYDRNREFLAKQPWDDPLWKEAKIAFITPRWGG